MGLDEVTGKRDLTFSRWHRKLPSDCTWVDIDCCHYCRYCSEPLALFELVRTDCELSLPEVCRRKVASITHRVGVRLGVPAFKIAYLPHESGEDIRSAAIMELGKPAVDVVSADELARFINTIHDCSWCGKHSSGRFKLNPT